MKIMDILAFCRTNLWIAYVFLFTIGLTIKNVELWKELVKIRTGILIITTTICCILIFIFNICLKYHKDYIVNFLGVVISLCLYFYEKRKLK